MTPRVVLLSKPVLAENLSFSKKKQLAIKGNADAQYNLGVMYSKGNAVTQNYAQALEWYKKAAD